MPDEEMSPLPLALRDIPQSVHEAFERLGVEQRLIEALEAHFASLDPTANTNQSDDPTTPGVPTP